MNGATHDHGIENRATNDKSQSDTREECPLVNGAAPPRNQKETSSSSASILKIALTSSLGGVLSGYHQGIIAVALPSISSSLSLSPAQEETVAGSLYLGGIFGCSVGGWMCDRIGRRITIQICGCVFVVGSIILSLSSNLEFLILGRMVTGFAVTLSPVANVAFLTEMAGDGEGRGGMVCLNELFVSAGYLVACVVGFVMAKKEEEGVVEEGMNAWRIMFGCPAVLALLQLQLLRNIPESGIWLKLREAELLSRPGNDNQNAKNEDPEGGSGGHQEQGGRDIATFIVNADTGLSERQYKNKSCRSILDDSFTIQDDITHKLNRHSVKIQPILKPSRYRSDRSNSLEIEDDISHKIMKHVSSIPEQIEMRILEKRRPSDEISQITETGIAEIMRPMENETFPPFALTANKCETKTDKLDKNHSEETGSGMQVTECVSNTYLQRAVIITLFLAVSEQFCGAVNIFNFAPELFAAWIGVDTNRLDGNSLIFVPSIFLAFLKVIVTAWVVTEVDTGLGRRPLLIGGIGIIVFSLFLLICAFRNEPEDTGVSLAALGAAGIAIGYSASYGPLTYLFTAELFPPHLRGRALGVMQVISSGCAYLVSYTLLSLQEVAGVTAPYILYFIVAMLSMTFALVAIPDTGPANGDEESFQVLEYRMNNMLFWIPDRGMFVPPPLFASRENVVRGMNPRQHGHII